MEKRCRDVEKKERRKNQKPELFRLKDLMLPYPTLLHLLDLTFLERKKKREKKNRVRLSTHHHPVFLVTLP